MMIDTLKADPGYPSLLKDIEMQIELYRKEIEAIDQELKTVEDEEKKNKLMKEKKDLHAKPG